MPNVNTFPSSKLKLDEFFLNWLSSQDSQRLVRVPWTRVKSRSPRLPNLTSTAAVDSSGPIRDPSDPEDRSRNRLSDHAPP
jgi:hypothetical protein